MTYFFLFLVAVVIGVILWQFLLAWFKSTERKIWPRLIDAASGSATILWARLVLLFGALGSGALQYGTLSENPDIKRALDGLLEPQTVMLILAAFAVLSEIARRRSKSEDPIK